MEIYNFFSTPIWIGEIDIDNEKLIEEIKKFKNKTKTVEISNIGGYQGKDFISTYLNHKIAEQIPRIESKPLSKYKIYSWVNINNKNNYNARHSHINTKIFLSGVYYVKIPENSGNIKFYDPRGPLMQGMTDHKYFYDGFSYQYIIPKNNMLIFFPSWLEHEVEKITMKKREYLLHLIFL